MITAFYEHLSRDDDLQDKERADSYNEASKKGKSFQMLKSKKNDY